ncbi:hypothetical protein evm_011250 [Chilo suppressalis]|nr:hypothetical protein evm_011250 [Chilo suppressalis]
MKILAYTGVLFAFATIFVQSIERPYYDIKDAPYLFHKFIRDYNRQYKNTEEVILRYTMFLNSLMDINKRNANQEAIFDINQFADYTNEEFGQMNGYRPNREVPLRQSLKKSVIVVPYLKKEKKVEW